MSGRLINGPVLEQIPNKLECKEQRYIPVSEHHASLPTLPVEIELRI